MIWDDETTRDLRRLWTERHSTSEIARRLGCSKNAAVGKAHRLDLEARPSPIHRPAGAIGGHRPSVPRAVGPTIPPLASDAKPPAMPLAIAQTRVVAPPPPPPVRVVRRASMTCCWPLGEPGTRTFRFCDDTAVPGKPYCGEHAKLAYVRVRDRSEAAA